MSEVRPGQSRVLHPLRPLQHAGLASPRPSQVRAERARAEAAGGLDGDGRCAGRDSRRDGFASGGGDRHDSWLGRPGGGSLGFRLPLRRGRRVRKLDGYMVREMIVPFLIGTVVVVMMFQINTYMYLAKTFNLDNVPTSAVYQYIFYKTPEFMKMTLAVGTAMGSSLAMTRIARESELTAMRAAGIRILRVVLPVAIFGIGVAVLNFYLMEKIMPVSTRKANDIARSAAILGLDSNSFRDNAMIKLGNFTASFKQVRKVGTTKLQIDDILLVERPNDGKTHLTLAKRGFYDRGVWDFKECYYYVMKGPDLISFEPRERFSVNEKIVIDQFFGGTIPEEQTLEQLYAIVESKKKTNTESRKEEIEIQTRYAIPVACLIFSVVSPVFAIMFSRSGGFVGVLVAFVTVLLYYNAFVTSTQILGKIQEVPPWVAAWTPNIAFMALGVMALRRLE
ncbi:YjgP/YjgQ family permease [bacterium]|nr:MAG: YjgP/YjgQ family permease [bacterium]